MPATDPALSAALDNLTTQVNPDNILAVHKVFCDRADALDKELRFATQQTRVGLCGGDPISIDAANTFNAKVDALLETHRAHQRELVVAAAHLKQIALSYGNTEAEIAGSLEPHVR